jgi:hypothetical protein
MKNRIALAERIAAYISENMPTATAQNLMLLDEASWARIAGLAGAKTTPSDGTITAVIALVRGKELLTIIVQTILERS